MRNETGVLIGMIHIMLTYAILTLYANMRGIDVGLVAAARSLGASRFQAFRMVFLPLTRPGLIGAGHAGLHPVARLLRHARACWAAARC